MEEGLSNTVINSINLQVNDAIKSSKANIEINDHYNKKYQKLMEMKKNRHIFKRNYKYPIYNFTSITLPDKFINLLRSYDQKSAVMGKHFDEMIIKSEVDNLFDEVEFENILNNESLYKRERDKEILRKCTYNFIRQTKLEMSKDKHQMVFTLAKELGDFCKDKKISILSPDKGKGHVICWHKDVDQALADIIEENYEPVNLHHNSKLKFLKYRESKITKALFKFEKNWYNK